MQCCTKQFDLCLYRHLPYQETIVWRAEGELVDLTDADGRLVIRPSYESATILADLTPGDGLEFGGIEGTITYTIPAIVTTEPRGVWSLVITLPGDEPLHLVGGAVIFHGNAVY